MSVLYLVEHGAVLQRRAHQLEIQTPTAEDPVTIGFELIEQLVVAAHVTISAGALSGLLDAGVPTVFLAGDGRYRGCLVPEPSAFAELRLSQYRLFHDRSARRQLANRIVRGKIAAQRRLLRYWRWRGQPTPAQCLLTLDACSRACRSSLPLDRLLGIEGTASAAFFDALRLAIPADWRFSRRNRRPPRDPVNAMLSFGYTLLVAVALSQINTVGMDPFIGVLHAPARSRPSLALDLVEEFRPLVDAYVLETVASGTLTPDDFSYPIEGGCRLSDTARRAFISGFEALMTTRFWYGQAEGHVTLRQVVLAQARRLARVHLGKQATYSPFLPRQ